MTKSEYVTTNLIMPLDRETTMNGLISNNPLTMSGEKTINSQELLVMVNEARRQYGEPEIRNNKFIEKVTDELEGEYYTKSVVQKMNGTESVVIDMALKQALRVAARESKAVRRSLVDQLEARNQPEPVNRELSTMEILQIAMASEQGRLVEKERADHAIRTKSHISRKREASALGRLSAATRRCRELESRLGESTQHATIINVENATGQKKAYSYVPLRRWCRDNSAEAKDVPDERYGSVKSWPAGAWLAVYGINLNELLGSKK